MKITIYIRYDQVETLYKFLRGENERDVIDWYEDRPSGEMCYMVTIDYNDFVKLQSR